VRVTLYARVSSERQAEKDMSIAAQLKALRKYAVEHGWEVYREFVDEAESARSTNRPAFKEMIALARQRHKCFDAILVWKLSRFARNREDSIIYKSLLRKYDISVVSMNEQVDDSPAGKLLEGMIEVIDEFYSINLAQDTRVHLELWSPLPPMIRRVQPGAIDGSPLSRLARQRGWMCPA
jgi:site-specific DNA recombinase